MSDVTCQTYFCRITRNEAFETWCERVIDMKAKVCPNDALDRFITSQTTEEIEGTDNSYLVYDTLQSTCVSPRAFHDLSDNSPFVDTRSATTENAVPSEVTSSADHSPSATLVRKRCGTGGEVKGKKVSGGYLLIAMKTRFMIKLQE